MLDEEGAAAERRAASKAAGPQLPKLTANAKAAELKRAFQVSPPLPRGQGLKP